MRSRKTASNSESKESQASKKLTFKSFIILLAISFACAIILGRIGHLLLNKGQYGWDMFFVWQGGLVFYGGVVLAVITIIIYLKIKRLSILKVGDLIMPMILLGLAFGRIGCFLNGCCYGKVSYKLWAACFPPIYGPQGKLIGSPAYLDHFHQGLITQESLTSLPVHPTQLYESLLSILIYGLLTLIWLRKDRFSADGKQVEGRHGIVVAWAGIFYSIVRFTLEFFRGDNKSFIMGLSYSQLVSIGLFIVSLGLMLWLAGRKKKSETVISAV